MVADLHQHGVFELEHTQLNTRLWRGVCRLHLGHSLCALTLICRLLHSERVLGVGRHKYRENLLGTLHNPCGHTRKPCNVNTERVVGTAPLEFAQEEHCAIYLFDRHIVVLDPWEALLHLVELVVVCRKERLSLCSGIVVEILNHTPRNGYTIVGARTPTNLVEEYKATVGYIVENCSTLQHLDHKGTLALRDVVAGTHSCENFIHNADVGARCGNIAAHLCHQYNECRLAQERTLTRHIGTRNHHNLLTLGVEHHIVGHILLADGHQHLNHGVATIANVDTFVLANLGSYITPLGCEPCERAEAVEVGNNRSVALQTFERCGEIAQQLLPDASLNGEDFLLCSEHLLLILFQLGSDVSLGTHKRLLANPLGRHFVLVGIAHLDIVAKDIVVANPQRGDTRALALRELNLCYAVFAVEGNVAQLVEFDINARGNDTSLLYLVVLWVGIDCASNGAPLLLHCKELFAHLPKSLRLALGEQQLELLNSAQRLFEGIHLARSDALCCNARGEPFEVANSAQILHNGFAHLGRGLHCLHNIKPAVEPLDIFDGHCYPMAQEPTTHRGRGAVYCLHKRALAIGRARGEEFQVANRKAVNPHITIAIYAGNGANVVYVFVLGIVEVVHHSARSCYGCAHTLNAEAFEALHIELLAEPFASNLLVEHPPIKTVRVVVATHSASKPLLLTPFIDNLLGGKGGDEFVDVGIVTLANIELASREVEQCNAVALLLEVECGKEDVFACREHIFVHHHTRCYELHHATLYESLDTLGVFELFAHSHPATCAHQLGEIVIYGVEGETRHLDIVTRTITFACERNAEYGGCLHSIFAVGFVEVAHSEQQNSISISRLNGEILLHQWGLFGFLLLCHLGLGMLFFLGCT